MNLVFLDSLRSQWNKLAPGERRLATIGGIVLGFTLLYILFWLPVQAELTRLRQSVPVEHAQLLHMRSQAASIAPLRSHRGTKPAAGTLLSVIEQSATARGMRGFITRMDASGSNNVQLTLEAVSFNSLLSWLADLQDSYSLRVESTTVDAHTAPGTVKAKLKLSVDIQ